ncbi:MAG: right-handed parallel beta-helix repeat-containing protein [Methanobrevibacter sp.]|nr:right-handed parallel beta-helix repeat-containing protein [Methanobrevibacter sp.]MEA4957471.1 right-handed parallel beta-helix repeat-containing protein [Methanobrevibacter sp.]
MIKFKKMLILAIIFMFLFLVVANVSAVQYNINNKNSSESISDLLDFDIEDGDTIFLEDGVYDNFYLSFSNSININANPGKVYLKGSGFGRGIEGDADYINISNICLSNYDVGIYLSGSSFNIINVTSNNNKGSGICIMDDEGTSIFRNVVANNNENGVDIYGFNKLNIYNLTTNNNKENGLILSFGGVCNIYNSTFDNNGDSGIDAYDYVNMNIYNSKATGNSNSLFSMEGNYKIFDSDFKNIIKDGEVVNTVPKINNKPKFLPIIFFIKKGGYYYKLYSIANIGNASGTKNFKIKVPKGYVLVGFTVNTRVVGTYSGLSRVISFNINNLPVYNNKKSNLALICLVLVKDGKKGFKPLGFKFQRGYKKINTGKYKIRGLGNIKYKTYQKGNNLKIQFFFKGISFRTVSMIKDKSKITTVTRNIGKTKTKQKIQTNMTLKKYYSLYMNILKKW